MRVVSHLTPAQLKQRMLATEERRQFQRWQVIYLMSSGRFRAAEAAQLVGVARGTVYQWVHLYNRQGPKALDLQGRGGRRNALLSWEEEGLLLAELSEKAKQGRVVVAWTVRDRVEKKLGHSVSKDYAYDLLHRHGWRKIAPRPRHPKGKSAVQEQFKKNFPRWWLPPPEVLPKTTNGR
jgi:transposase